MSRKARRSRRGGSRGCEGRAGRRGRACRRSPATTAIHAPASEAMCRPSRVLCSRSSQVHQRGLAEVVVGELEVADLGGDDRLRARRQRRVAHGERLVVGEVARLLLGGERVAAQVHRQHEVGLLDHLLAVEVEVREVQQQRVARRAACARSPSARGAVKPSACGCTPSSSSYGHDASRRRRRARPRSPPSSTPSAARRVAGGARRPRRRARRFRCAIRFV